MNPFAALTVSRALLGQGHDATTREERPWPGARRAPAVSPVFLVEHYLPDVTASEVNALTGRLAAAAGASPRGTAPVRLLGSVGVPQDETLIVVMAAPSAEAAATTMGQTEIEAARILPAFWAPGRPR